MFDSALSAVFHSILSLVKFQVFIEPEDLNYYYYDDKRWAATSLLLNIGFKQDVISKYVY